MILFVIYATIGALCFDDRNYGRAIFFGAAALLFLLINLLAGGIAS